ncbi:MAG: hypothetical protein K2O20_08885, partial [Duncaniella sp.]|nr:hypothetical protein [Duncaniella sp.]
MVLINRFFSELLIQSKREENFTKVTTYSELCKLSENCRPADFSVPAQPGRHTQTLAGKTTTTKQTKKKKTITVFTPGPAHRPR